MARNKTVQWKRRAAPSSARYSYAIESLCMPRDLVTSIPRMWYFAINSLTIQGVVCLNLFTWSDPSKDWFPWQQRGRGGGMRCRDYDPACPTEKSALWTDWLLQRRTWIQGWLFCFKCGRKLPMKGAKTETGDNPYAIGIRWTLSQTIFVHDIPTSDSTEKKNMPPRDMWRLIHL